LGQGAVRVGGDASAGERLAVQLLEEAEVVYQAAVPGVDLHFHLPVVDLGWFLDLGDRVGQGCGTLPHLGEQIFVVFIQLEENAPLYHVDFGLLKRTKGVFTFFLALEDFRDAQALVLAGEDGPLALEGRLPDKEYEFDVFSLAEQVLASPSHPLTQMQHQASPLEIRQIGDHPEGPEFAETVCDQLLGGVLESALIVSPVHEQQNGLAQVLDHANSLAGQYLGLPEAAASIVLVPSPVLIDDFDLSADDQRE
jgi:hypothetical protein